MFCGVAHWPFPLNELCTQEVVKSWVSLRNTELQNFSFTADGCSAQAYSFEYVGRTYSVSLSSLAIFILQPKVVFLIN
jgi:hypothetical protein